MKIRVLAIAPYAGLKDLLLEMLQDVDTIDMDVEAADLQEAIPLVEHAERSGYDVIVSRGGTASLIRQQVTLPVVDIPVSGYDILRVLTLVKNSHSKVAIIGFPNICHGVAQISSLLDFDIPAYAVQHESEVSGALHRAFDSGIQLVLGDVVTVRHAQQMGYRGMLITSGKESVADALAEVVRVYEVYKRGQENSRFYTDILDADARGILVLDEARRVSFANLAACRILNSDRTQLFGQHMVIASPALAQLIKQAEEDAASANVLQYIHLGDRQYKVMLVPRGSEERPGALIYLDSLEQERIDRRLSAYIPPKLATFTQLVGVSSSLQKAVTRAKKFALTDRNIWISGERGTGKSLFAQAIHSASKERHAGFYSIPCEEMTEEQTEQLLMGTAQAPGLLRGGFGGTIYLAHADRLPRTVQETWLQAVRSTSVRWIASSSIPMTRLQNRIEYNRDLLLALGEVQLVIPPLRDRPEDIEEIVRGIIADYNSESGKQIVGMREPVLERLSQYEWPGNSAELDNRIREMLILTKGHYTELGEVAEVLEQLGQPAGATSAGTSYAHIDLSGTFEEIEERILVHVLQEEGMNQSKTCKRLGINRSTLWRKTNKMFKN
ncbi:sigma-54-dependent Fis family transcriptional regulator [Paenibacillus cremeus]|uniref:Fis family transcriptional regulator n=1 Tax=Paenibacillus cremeus TaxID=2163881 RepID=A0A559KF89_9BACL|nr:sigma-54-dependent Fis family transcriptional regulator [Paenibacillus cremeus]TVY10778.1 Fis family transcriptional regulator [Paenibacillus cremeus]